MDLLKWIINKGDNNYFYSDKKNFCFYIISNLKNNIHAVDNYDINIGNLMYLIDLLEEYINTNRDPLIVDIKTIEYVRDHIKQFTVPKLQKILKEKSDSIFYNHPKYFGSVSMNSNHYAILNDKRDFSFRECEYSFFKDRFDDIVNKASRSAAETKEINEAILYIKSLIYSCDYIIGLIKINEEEIKELLRQT